MTSLTELKEALKATLASRGALNPIKARIRAEIFNALDNDQTTKPRLSNTNLLMNELIREYLEFNNYKHALSVFLPESGQPEQPAFDRLFLTRELHIQENQHSIQIPLLYSIVAMLQQGTVPSTSSSSSSSSSSNGNNGNSNVNAANTNMRNSAPTSSSSSSYSSSAPRSSSSSYQAPTSSSSSSSSNLPPSLSLLQRVALHDVNVSDTPNPMQFSHSNSTHSS